MFSCSACFRRAIHSLLQDLPSESLQPALRAQSVTKTPARPSRRNHSTSTAAFRTKILPFTLLNHGNSAGASKRYHSTVQSIRKGHHIRLLREAFASTEPIPLKRKTLYKGPSRVTVRDRLARERNRSALELRESGDPDQSSLSIRAKEQYAVQFLKDPLKLASTVLGRLRIGDVNGAMELVRASDREKVENVVSWNHIMDYEMNYQNVKGALKVYNEVSCCTQSNLIGGQILAERQSFLVTERC
jgi:hypothetical protein